MPTDFKAPKDDSGPARNLYAVTPHDTNDLAAACRGLWIGGAGTITVDVEGVGEEILISGVPAGTLLPICATRVYATGTSATLIVALN